MKHPLVSIITPTYNHENYIKECIESVLKQSYPYWEMVIIDDGSTDKTCEIVSNYLDDRIIYIKQNNIGPYNLGKTYNKALSICHGELIAILEGDDFWPEDKLEKQVKAFEDPEVILSHGRSKIVYSNKIRKINIKEIDSIMDNNPIGSALYGLIGGIGSTPIAVTLMIRKSVLNEIGGFKQPKELPLVDFPTELELSLRGKFKFIDWNLGYFRRHNSSITHIYRNEMKSAAIHYSKDFLKINASQIVELGISIDEMLSLIKKKESDKSLVKIIHARELLNLKEYNESRILFKEVLLKDKLPKNKLLFKLISIWGLLGSYLQLDLIELIVKPYSKIISFYWNLKK